MRWLLLSLSLFTLTAPAADASVPMLLPVAIERPGGDWIVLGYPSQTLEPGETRLVMFCLRGAAPLLSPPMLTVIPETEHQRRDKVLVLQSTAGFFPVGDSALPPYVTYRIENLASEPTTYTLFIHIRGGNTHGDHGGH